MNELDLLITQNQYAQEMTSRLISNIPQEKWDTTPDVLKTNISWQVGHLVVSHIYHCIASVHGAPKELYAQIDIRTLAGLYGYGSDPVKSTGSHSPGALVELLELSHARSLESIKSLNADELDESLAATRVPHPIASNKREAISWNAQHTMWHNGQIGLIKRIIDERMDFGLDTSRLKN